MFLGSLSSILATIILVQALISDTATESLTPFCMPPASSIQSIFPCHQITLSKHRHNHGIPLIKKEQKRASLVGPWLRIHLPMQGTQVPSLVWEDPACCGATKPVHHNSWA